MGAASPTGVECLHFPPLSASSGRTFPHIASSGRVFPPYLRDFDGHSADGGVRSDPGGGGAPHEPPLHRAPPPAARPRARNARPRLVVARAASSIPLPSARRH